MLVLGQLRRSQHQRRVGRGILRLVLLDGTEIASVGDHDGVLLQLVEGGGHLRQSKTEEVR
jgi:archaeosine-15-forming tRNA-guanine transglycosylase